MLKCPKCGKYLPVCTCRRKPNGYVQPVNNPDKESSK